MTSYRHCDGYKTGHLSLPGIFGCLVLLTFAGFAQAEDSPDWLAQPYPYRIIDQDARQVLREFGRNLGVPMIISEGVKGRIRGNIQAPTAGAFLDRVSAAAGLTWYLKGDVVAIDSAANIATQSLHLGPIPSGSLDPLLASLQNGEGVAVRVDGDRSALNVSGPPGYIAYVQQRLDSLQRRPGRSSGIGVRVFRGGTGTEVVSTRS